MNDKTDIQIVRKKQLRKKQLRKKRLKLKLFLVGFIREMANFVRKTREQNGNIYLEIENVCFSVPFI